MTRSGWRLPAAFLFFLLLAPVCHAQKGGTFDHSAFDGFLKKYVNEAGNIDYASAQKDRAALDAYIDSFQLIEGDAVRELPKPEQIAFWLNAYHAHLIAMVLDQYPLKSTKDVPGFWNLQTVHIGPLKNEKGEPAGLSLSLSMISRDILTAEFEDEKIHLAVAWAARGGPLFPAEAFTGPRVLGQLFRAARREAGRPEMVQIDPVRKRVLISRSFEWFAPDFLTNFGRPVRRGKLNKTDTAIVNFLIRYAKNLDELRFLKSADFKIEYIPFDWQLNDSSASS